jgi:hypothetical protein
MNDKYKEHDSVMNSLDWSLSNSMGVDWDVFANTKQYKAISKAVWELVHFEFEEEEI